MPFALFSTKSALGNESNGLNQTQLFLFVCFQLFAVIYLLCSGSLFICSHLAFPSKCWNSPRSCKDRVMLQSLFSPKTNYLLLEMWYFSSTSSTLTWTSIGKILFYYAALSQHTQLSCTQNKYWAFVLSRGDSYVMINQKMPLRMREISTLILLKMNGWNELDKLVFSSDNCFASFLPPFGSSPHSFCLETAQQVLLSYQ